ncbi:hypothetical protein RBTH_09049 [Bacillus thuringiensis serovar israelensis ATCC 35646]|nr:hypothetical protein RBTH_09049 [Bacillus thuringiensis serovar israelensis ATCC 35646]
MSLVVVSVMIGITQYFHHTDSTVEVKDKYVWYFRVL